MIDSSTFSRDLNIRAYRPRVLLKDRRVWCFIGIMVLMGIVRKPSIHMYWSKDDFVSTPIFSNIMRRDRFEQIRRMIQFVDPLSQDPSYNLTKLAGFLDVLQENFVNNYCPGELICVDEYLSLWKGRLRFKVYIPNKRERYGVKVYIGMSNLMFLCLKPLTNTQIHPELSCHHHPAGGRNAHDHIAPHSSVQHCCFQILNVQSRISCNGIRKG